MLMNSDILLLAVLFIVVFAGALIWKLYDDFKRETKGLRKLHPRRRERD
jgi:hypothetical protein